MSAVAMAMALSCAAEDGRVYIEKDLGCCSNDRNTCEMLINLWRSFIVPPPRAPERVKGRAGGRPAEWIACPLPAARDAGGPGETRLEGMRDDVFRLRGTANVGRPIGNRCDFTRHDDNDVVTGRYHCVVRLSGRCWHGCDGMWSFSPHFFFFVSLVKIAVVQRKKNYSCNGKGRGNVEKSTGEFSWFPNYFVTRGSYVLDNTAYWQWSGENKAFENLNVYHQLSRSAVNHFFSP